MEQIDYFLSYAHTDLDDVKRFNEVFTPHLQTDSRFEFRRWMDADILPGQDWHKQIQTALEHCQFGLLLVSPAFLSSQYISGHELPLLLAKPTVVPVALHPIVFNGSMDLKGLGERQLYRDPKGRTFDKCGRKHTRREFALDLHQKLHTLLQRIPC